MESLIGGPLYSRQSSLPPLPVPSLDDTLRLYLQSSLALCSNESERIDLEESVGRFASEGGAKLQKRLEGRAGEAAASGTSWLQKWWNQVGYLSARDPLPVNVSYFFQLCDDTGASNGPSRGASMLVAAALFRRDVCSGEMAPETAGKAGTPLCAAPWKYMFNACRIPGRGGSDTYKIFDPSRYHHAVVARRGYFFEFRLVDPASSGPLPLEVIEGILDDVVRRSDDLSNRGHARGSCLGALTGQERGAWVRDRDALIKSSRAVAEALESIESSAILLCLDDGSPVSYAGVSSILWHGGQASGAACNRWFDKSVQLICTENGKAGLLGEHSMMDGMPVVKLAEVLTRVKYDQARKLAPSRPQSSYGEPPPTARFLDLSAGADASAMIVSATDSLHRLVKSQDLQVQCFRGYGGNFVKKQGVSPDAWVQLSIQLATFRLFGSCVATYEASQVRPFKHGRTETTRSCSLDSVAFCKEMGPRGDGGEVDARVSCVAWPVYICYRIR